nr:helix-turn-helix domain-containing protein [Rhizobium sophoriradicis]
MEERVRMLSDYVSGHWSVSDLCRRYGVSRETFYAWRKRQMSGADDWFVDRSHGTVSCPHRTPAALVDQVIALRPAAPAQADEARSSTHDRMKTVRYHPGPKCRPSTRSFSI